MMGMNSRNPRPPQKRPALSWGAWALGKARQFSALGHTVTDCNRYTTADASRQLACQL